MVKNINAFLNLDFLKAISISSYIAFNFIDRGMSNIFLILALILSLIDYKKVYETIFAYKTIYLSITLFTLWLVFMGIFHQSPISELDNYFRLILLLPLLSINFDDEAIKKVIITSVVLATIHFFYSFATGLEERYIGTASSQITYANLLVTFLILSIYFLSKNILSKNIVFFICIFVLSYLWILTGTRGPLISLVVASIVILLWSKNTNIFILAFFMISLIILTPNTLSDRLSNLLTLESHDSAYISDQSLKERAAYLDYGLHKISTNPFYGSGPQNVEGDMGSYLSENNFNVPSRDHLHNEFIDISVKFGLPGLILLLICYLSFYKNSHGSNKKLITLILISLILSQLTQSHFAHHQAITFFIPLIYILSNKRSLTIK